MSVPSHSPVSTPHPPSEADIDLAILSDRFRPSMIRLIAALAVYGVIICAGAVLGATALGTSGAFLGAAVFWAIAVRLLWEASPCMGSFVTVTLRPGANPVIQTGYVEMSPKANEVIISLRTPGLLKGRAASMSVGGLLQMEGFRYRALYLDDAGNLRLLLAEDDDVLPHSIAHAVQIVRDALNGRCAA